MTFFDKFRGKPDWLHPDASVRAAAVKRLGEREQTLLATIARQDEDAAVRRLAARRLKDPALLAEIARSDSHEAVRQEVNEILLEIANGEGNSTACEAAVAGLTDQRHLALVASQARLDQICRMALAHLSDPKQIASVARQAGNPAVRQEALDRVEDASLLADVAIRSLYKDVALAALARLSSDPAILDAIGSRARVKAVARRARDLLGIASPQETQQAPADESRRPESLAPPADVAIDPAPLTVDWDSVTRDRDARVSLCQVVESLRGAEIAEGLPRARASWEQLGPPPAGSSDTSILARFESACSTSELRRTEYEAERRRCARRDELAAAAEQTAELPDLGDAAKRLSELHAEWVQIQKAVIDSRQGLAGGMDRAVARLKERETQARELKVKEELARLEELCARVEHAVSDPSINLKEADRCFREAKLAIEDLGSLPSRKDREALARRLEEARRALYPRIQQLRDDDAWLRWANVGIREELCSRIEALCDSPNVEEAARQLREIESQWRQAGEIDREKGDQLWRRFASARDRLRARCDEHFAKKAAEHSENLRRKQALCEQAEALAESTDWIGTAETLQKLQAEWKTLGPVAPKDSNIVWERFRKACDHFFTRRKQDREQRSAAWSQNLALKESLCSRAEAIMDSTDWDQTAAELKRLQSEWRNVGAVRRSKSDAIWKRFRTACDHFFERYKRRDEVAMAAHLAAREGLCNQIESWLGPNGVEAPQELAVRLRELQAAWRQIGPIAPAQEAALQRRFTEARDRLVATYAAAFEGSELDPAANRRKMEKLCTRVEAFLAELGPSGTGDGLATDLAERLRNAFAANALGVRSDRGARWQAMKPEVEAAQAAWRRLASGPVDAGADMMRRFENACRRFYELRPHATGQRGAQTQIRR